MVSKGGLISYRTTWFKVEKKINIKKFIIIIEMKHFILKFLSSSSLLLFIYLNEFCIFQGHAIHHIGISSVMYSKFPVYYIQLFLILFIEYVCKNQVKIVIQVDLLHTIT